MTAGTPDRDRLQFVLGPADELRAEAYVRLVDGPADAVVRGTLTGPRCRRATTLPTTMPLRPLAGGRTAAARVIVTEPSYWTPDLPNLYELDAEACAPSGPVAVTRGLVGLRRLGVRGRSIWLDGRRWVPRGVAVADETAEAGAWSNDGLAAVVADPGPAACAAADVAGVPLLIAPDPAVVGRQLADRVSAWARHPAVVIVVLDVERATALTDAKVNRGTLLVGCVTDGVEQPPRAMPTGVDCLVMRLELGASPAAAWRTDAPEVPIVAWRRAAGGTRRDCDALQAQLAAWGNAGGTPAWDWAGYVVA